MGSADTTGESHRRWLSCSVSNFSCVEQRGVLFSMCARTGKFLRNAWVVLAMSASPSFQYPAVTAVAIAGAKIEISSKYANGKSPAVPTFRERMPKWERGESMGSKINHLVDDV